MRIGPESTSQIQIVNWVKQCTKLKVYHFVNEGKRSPTMGNILVRMGMTAGVSDLFFPRSNSEYKGLWLELKVGSRKLSTHQQKFLDDMIEEGYCAVCCIGTDASIAFICEFYGLTRPTIVLNPFH